MAVSYVGPYSPAVYSAANKIQSGGTPTPYSPTIVSAAQKVISSQPNVASSTGGSVLGSSTQQAQQQPSGNVFESAPQAPTFDETPFNNLIDQINGLGNVFQQQFATSENTINTNTTNALSDLESNKKQGETSLDLYNQQAKTDTEANVNEQRRAQSEIQQGLQARYGGTTGTGAFVAELAGNQTLRNIAQYRGLYQQEMAKSQALRTDLLQTYISEKNKLEASRNQLIAEARDNLSQKLAELNTQKAQTLVAKSQQRTALVSQYQQLVSEINARNTAYAQKLDTQARDLQNTLLAKQYSLTYEAANKLPDFYESALKNGSLSSQGLRQAESSLGLPSNTLVNPNDPSSFFQNQTGGGSVNLTPKNDEGLLNQIYSYFTQ